ncbi:MAG: hypothetical protein FWC43_05755 [Planctomycetaceae bacterium]|nr:hypothetical protein [Planctomycetaceae bacterium]
MIALKEYTDQESMMNLEDSAVSYRTRQQKRVPRKKGRHSKVIRNRSFYDHDEEVDFDLEDHEFLDDELISLDEFDSIINKTKGKTFNGRDIEDEEDHGNSQMDFRKDSPHSVVPGKPARRKKVQRRRQIDPTTCERDYTAEEVEFMTALDEYKRNSGRMFPTCSEILEVLTNLGYAKVPPVPQPEQVLPPVPVVHQEQTVISVMEFSAAQPLVLTVENFVTEIPPVVAAIYFEYNQECSPLLLNDFFG